MFDLQRGLYDDPAASKAAHPGRRSGKSEFVPRAAALDALDAGFDEVIVIGAETQKKARQLHWRKLERLVSRIGLPFSPNKQDGTWTTPWGAVIVFWGVKDEGAVDLLRGFKLRTAYFDEVATYTELLDYLTKDVVEPALQDTGGTLYLLGTPSYTRAGAWFKICNGDTPGWSVHHWDVRRNKRFPRDAEAMLRRVREKNGWTEDSATYMREYLGLFVNDPTSLVYHYNASRNDLRTEPPHLRLPNGEIDHRNWCFVVGVDFGVTKPCAWVVWGWHVHARQIYALHAEKHAGLLVDDAARVTARVCNVYHPISLVGDVGGLGKPYEAEWNARYAGRTVDLQFAKSPDSYVLPPMKAADKAGKLGHIRLFNNELGASPPRALIAQPAAKVYSDELATLPYKDPEAPDDLLKEHPGHANHACDAGLYGYIETRTYTNEAPGPALADLTSDEAAEWQERNEALTAMRRANLLDWERF